MKPAVVRALFVLVLFALAWALPLGCGGGGGTAGTSTTGTTGQPGVVLNTPTKSITPNTVITITANVPSQSVQTVVFSTNGGTLTQTGPTTANFSSSANGIFTITATSIADPTKKGTIKITVASVGITISPNSATVNIGQTIIFTATVVGTSNNAVTYTASGGTIVQTSPTQARFTAPNTPAHIIVTATSVANPSISAQANVIVNQGSGTNATVITSVVSDSGTSVSGVIVQFLNASGNVVAQSTVKNGQLNAAVPPTARSFTLLPSSFPSQYYVSYEYKSKFYSPNIQGCYSLLPPLQAGQTAVLPSNITLLSNSGPPPPPPDGCGT